MGSVNLWRGLCRHRRRSAKAPGLQNGWRGDQRGHQAWGHTENIGLLL